jgi:hypothetical protein
MEQGIIKAKQALDGKIYSDFEVRFEKARYSEVRVEISLEASHVLQPKAVHKVFETLGCRVIPICRWLVGQGLDDSIDLIVVGPVGKSEEFVFEVNEPGCLSRQEHLTICEFFQLEGHACQLASFWNDSDCREPGGVEILYQRSSQPRFFNQDFVGPVFFRLRNSLCFQFRIKKPIS